MSRRRFLSIAALACSMPLTAQSARGQPQRLDVHGWPIVDDLKAMTQNQIRLNAIGDLARNLVQPLQTFATLGGSEEAAKEAAQSVAEGLRDASIEKHYADQAPPTSFDSLTNLAKAYDAALEKNTAEIADPNDDASRATRDRATFDDKALCNTKLLICSNSAGLLGALLGDSSKTCANSILYPLSKTGRRVINVVKVRCSGYKATIVRTWSDPQTYGGSEVQMYGDETVFHGSPFSQYCTPCLPF